MLKDLFLVTSSIRCLWWLFSLISYFHDTKAKAWASPTSVNNVVQDFPRLVPGLKININVSDSRVLQIVKSLLTFP